MRTIEKIIKDAGGLSAVARRLKERGLKGDVTTVAKWRQNGIPDRHWPILIELAEATPAELFAANQAVRETPQEAA